MVAQATQAAHSLRYLGQELHALPEVVVPGQGDVLDSVARQDEAATLLTLLAQARDAAPAASQRDLAHLHTALERALSGLLAFAAPLDGVQQEARARLGRNALDTLAWAWQRQNRPDQSFKSHVAPRLSDGRRCGTPARLT